MQDGWLTKTLTAAVAGVTALVWAIVTFVWFAYRVGQYCEDESAGCTDAAPVRASLMAVAAAVGIVALVAAARRAARAAPDSRARDLRPPLLRALLAFLVWFLLATSLLIR